MVIRRVNQIIWQGMRPKRVFCLQFSSENHSESYWKPPFSCDFELKLVFQMIVKFFLWELRPCSRYWKGALNIAGYANKKIMVIRRVNRKIFGETSRGGEEIMFFFFVSNIAHISHDVNSLAKILKRYSNFIKKPFQNFINRTDTDC